MSFEHTSYSPSPDSLIIPPKSDFGIIKADNGFEIHDPENGLIAPVPTKLGEAMYDILRFQGTMEAAWDVRRSWKEHSDEAVKEAEEVSAHYSKTEYTNCNITVQSVAPYLFKDVRTKVKGIFGGETVCEAESKEFEDRVRVTDIHREEMPCFSKDWPSIKEVVNKAIQELESPIVFRLLSHNLVNHSCFIVASIDGGEDFIVFERQGAGNHRGYFFNLRKLSEVVRSYQNYTIPPIKTYQIAGMEKGCDVSADGLTELQKAKFSNGKYFTLDDFPPPPEDFKSFGRLTA